MHNLLVIQSTSWQVSQRFFDAVFATELGKDVARLQEAAATVASAVEEGEAALTTRREESAAADEDIRRTGDDLAEAQERHCLLAKEQRRLEARHAYLLRSLV